MLTTPQPGDATWSSHVLAPEDIPDIAAVQWDDSADVVVVGFGGAGVTTALQAREAGASVLVLDRFDGGGATAVSGGVVYAGGGTPYQREVGYDDDPDNMYAYLSKETQGVVRDDTLHRFCRDSVPNLAWLERHGVPFEASLCPVKTSYPTDDYYLYYSGNESIEEYAAVARPAPRGHRAKGKGLPGASFYGPLRASALAAGVRLSPQTLVHQLVRHEGRVVGVRGTRIAKPLWARLHRALWRMGMAIKNYVPRLGRHLHDRCAAIERSHGEPYAARATRGVVLAAGGFIFNREMVEHHAPKYRRGMPLGTPGCDGSGIRLGQSVGGAVDLMDRVSAWRFINPPQAWAKGIFVNAQGARYCNESVYGAKLGRHMAEDHDGVGILIIDDALRREAFQQLGPGKAQWFQQAPGVVNMLANSRSAPTITALADAIGADPEVLRATLRAYNDAASQGLRDPFGKSDAFRQPMPDGPYYAMNCGLRSKRFPCPTLTLGGLVLDEDTGAVLTGEGTPVPGLFAAGRTAVGVSSHEYVSGLSLADCVFSGRRAGRSAAKRP